MIALVLLASVFSGCAHVSPRRRLARTLVATGAVGVVIGGLVAAGCVNSEANGCSGGPQSVNLGAGIPVMVIGAALITAGLLVRPPGAPSRLFKPTTPQPVPVNPDPFVEPIPQY